MRVRQPSWAYLSRGPFLTTQFDWRTGTHRSWADETMIGAMLRTINAMSDMTLAVVIVDGQGEFIFGRSAKDAPPDEQFFVGTRQVYDLSLEVALGQEDVAFATLELFTAIMDWMGVK